MLKQTNVYKQKGGIDMKVALLIPVVDTRTGAALWIWQTPSERDLSRMYGSKAEAMAHKPTGRKALDDGYSAI